MLVERKSNRALHIPTSGPKENNFIPPRFPEAGPPRPVFQAISGSRAGGAKVDTRSSCLSALMTFGDGRVPRVSQKVCTKVLLFRCGTFVFSGRQKDYEERACSESRLSRGM